MEEEIKKTCVPKICGVTRDGAQISRVTGRDRNVCYF